MKERMSSTKERVKQMVKLGIYQFQDPYYQGVAAQIAFFLFLSILPTLILLSQILGLFSLSLGELQNWVDINISGEGVELIDDMLNYSPSGANSVFLAITALWAGSRAQFALIRVTNYTLTDGKSTGEGYVRDRIRSLKTILITVFTIAFALVALVYGPAVLKLIFGKILDSEITDAAWMALRWPLTAALYFLMISYIYYVMPTEKVPFVDVVPGSVFSSVGFLVVTAFFNIYTSYSVNYDILYGSFSSFVVLLVWFWFMAWVMCLGITLNRVWWATRKKGNRPIAPEAQAKRKPINIF